MFDRGAKDIDGGLLNARAGGLENIEKLLLKHLQNICFVSL